ncbi:hypothetical protein QC589_01430 [Halomonas elongata]|uniref:hypothetical protein n=1 Tax=Halomonas elongata TaxID=2746 RepID=UPI003362A034
MSVWLLSIEALDPLGQPETLRFATGEYRDPAAHRWIPRIQQPGLYRAGFFAGDLINVSRSGYGDTVLINADGGINWLAGYATDGREAVLSNADGGTVTEVFTGTVSRVSFDGRLVRVRLRDPVELLQQPHPNNRYAGDNVLPDGLEGTGDDIAGTLKPRVYGEVRNAAPTLVNSAKLIYQVSDQACTVTAVYDNGVALDYDGEYVDLDELEGTPPDPGQWQDWEPPNGKWRRINGYIRLGDSPAGQITVDADAPLAGAGDVLEQIAIEAGAAVGDVSALNTRGAIRLWVTNETTTAELLDQIVTSVGGWWRIDSSNTVQAGLLAEPGAAVLTLHDHQIISISRDATGAGSNGLPVHRVTWRCDRIETTQTDLSGAVSESRKSRLAKQYRETEASDSAVLDRHPLASEISVDSRLASRSAGQQAATDVLTLLSPRRDSLSVEARVLDAASLAIGDTVRVVTPRLGYDNGRDLLVTVRTLNAERNRLTLNLWG